MRILSLHPATTELVFALGAGNMLVGRCDSCTYPEAALSIPSIGNASEATTDKVAIFEPDLVLTGPGQDISFPAWQNVNISPESLVDVYDTITSLGARLGKHVEAEILVHDLQNTCERIRAKASRFKSVTIGVWCAPEYIDDLITLGAGEAVPLDAQPHLILVLGSEEDAELFIAKHADLKAVQNERVFTIEEALFYPTPRLIDGAKRLAKLLHGIEINGS